MYFAACPLLPFFLFNARLYAPLSPCHLCLQAAAVKNNYTIDIDILFAGT